MFATVVKVIVRFEKEYFIVMPRVQVPKTERIRCPKQCKSMKGFYFYLELGLPPHPMQWSGARSPKPRFTAVFISLEQRQGVGQG